MGEVGRRDELLAGAFVEADVFRLRPDYRAMLVAVDGIVPSPSDDASDALLQAAEAAAREALDASAVEQIPHVAEQNREGDRPLLHVECLITPAQKIGA